MIPWRLYVLGAGMAAALGGLAYVKHLQRSNTELRTEAATAAVQVEVTEQSAVISDRRARETAKVHRKAEEGRDAIQNSTDLDRALELYGDALDSVRQQGHAPIGPDAPPDGKRSEPRRRPEKA